MVNKYDPLLHARKEALLDLSEDLTDEEFAIAEKAIEILLDKIEYELEHSSSVKVEETGHLIITSNFESSPDMVIHIEETEEDDLI